MRIPIVSDGYRFIIPLAHHNGRPCPVTLGLVGGSVGPAPVVRPQLFPGPGTRYPE